MTLKLKQNKSNLISNKKKHNIKVTAENVPELDKLINTMIQKLKGSSVWGCTVCSETFKKQYL